MNRVGVYCTSVVYVNLSLVIKIWSWAPLPYFSSLIHVSLKDGHVALFPVVLHSFSLSPSKMDTSKRRTPFYGGHVELVPVILKPFTLLSVCKLGTSLRQTCGVARCRTFKSRFLYFPLMSLFLVDTCSWSLMYFNLQD